MSDFKDRLWQDLVRAHGADLAQLSRPASKRRPRPRMLAGTGVGLAAAGTTAAILVGAAGTSPAFAVTKNHDGSVTVSITRLAGIPGANARLAALGYRARIVQVTAACGPPGRWARSIHHPMFRQVRAGARFDPRQVPPGRVLVLPAWRAGHTISVRPGQMIHGQVPACLPPPMPPPGALGGACCPRFLPIGPPGRQVLPGPSRQIPARPCPNARRQRLSRPRSLQIPGGPRLQIPGGAQLQISGGPHLQVTSGRQLQIRAGRPNQHGQEGAWIHIAVSCPPPPARWTPGAGQSRPRPR